jgi:hypothetical protein
MRLHPRAILGGARRQICLRHQICLSTVGQDCAVTRSAMLRNQQRTQGTCAGTAKFNRSLLSELKDPTAGRRSSTHEIHQRYWCGNRSGVGAGRINRGFRERAGRAVGQLESAHRRLRGFYPNQLIGDSTGSLSGTLTYTQIDAIAATEDVCADTVTGTTTAPTGSFAQPDGSFTIALSLASPQANPAGCGGATVDLLCNRTLVHHNLVSDLDAGTYHCVATSVTPTGGSVIPASLTVRIGSVEGANAPTD